MSVILDSTKYDITKIVKAAYELSQPVGMGILHFIEGDIPNQTLDDIVGDGTKDIYMDYIHGRACKFNTKYDHETGNHIIMRDDWFDHTPEQFQRLLQRGLI